MVHFVHCNKTIDTSHVSDLYFWEIVILHWISNTMFSGQDYKFISHFWRTLLWKPGTILNFNSSHHPQTNRSLKNLNVKQWDLVLLQIEFSYNRSIYQSIERSLFEVVYGLNPIGPLDLAPHPISKQFSGDAME